MNLRRTKIVILCEDVQHAAFVRRFLYRSGVKIHDIRVMQAPSSGSAEQWVRQQYPEELELIRKVSVAAKLIVITDGDNFTVEQRIASLDEECRNRKVTSRDAGDPVAILVPRRNIESWLAYLSGQDVDEKTRSYPKLEKPRDCDMHTKALKEMCDRKQLRTPVPSSLKDACDEFQQRLI